MKRTGARHWAHWSAFLAVIILMAGCGGGKTNPEADAAGNSGASGAFTCPEPANKVELTSKELNLFVWTEYIPDEMIDCFEQVYGVKVNRSEFSSNEEMYAKLAAGNTSYDLAQPTDQIVELMVRQNLLEKLDASKLPALQNFDPAFLAQPFDPKNEYTIPYQGGMDAIAVNTATVQDPPKSFGDLWNPDFASRLVMVDDARTIIGATLLSLGYDVNTTDAAQLNEARIKLGELVPNVNIFDSDSPKTALIAGDADLGIVWTGEVLQAAREVPSIKFIYPTEGAIRWQDNWAIPTGAPHPDAAYAWLNYINQPELFWMTMRDFPYINPNKASLAYAKENQPALYEAYMASNITNVPADVLAKAHRIQDVGEATVEFDRIWTEVKGQ